jgi:hypothetical protein
VARRVCDLENFVNEEAIARDWAAAPCEKKSVNRFVCIGSPDTFGEMKIGIPVFSDVTLRH